MAQRLTDAWRGHGNSPRRSLGLRILALVILLTPCAAPAQQPGQITYRLQTGSDVFSVAAMPGATPQNVSQALEAIAPGSDIWLSISPDGEWLLLNTERFDPGCAGFACLAILSRDLQSRELVRPGGTLIHPDGLSAVASGGNLIVYEAGDGPHTRDLWAVSRSGGGWSMPALLTGSSPYQYNSLPAISGDGSRVVFDCGDQPFGGPGTGVCEVGTAGSGFRVVLTIADHPPGFMDTGALHSPHYAPDGSIVFEADWDGERIWRLPLGATVPVKVAGDQFPNDNTPCVLLDGRIASLWLNRPGNPSGLHELKVMAADGSSFFMVLTGVDLLDGGLGCGGGVAPPPGSFTLTVATAGSGSGTVASTPLGISCPPDCVEAYPGGTMVRLVASSAGDSLFAGWSGGGCGGTGPCDLVVTGDTMVMANFALMSQAGLQLVLNRQTFRPGDTMIVTVALTPGVTPVVVDAYIVLRLPAGTLLSLQAGGGAAPGIVPIAPGFTPVPFSGDLLRHTFGGGEPAGTYTWYSALAETGTANLIGPIDQDAFAFTP